MSVMEVAATRTLDDPLVSSWRHVPALDGLRALAVVAVLLFHGGYLEGGFLGVDLFFALSGFLITSLLVRDATRTTLSLRAFWGRRLRRLLPALFTLLVVAAAWAAAVGTPAQLDSVRRDGPWALAYVANWHSIAESGGYWESFSQPSMFDHLWSLAIEEQFYLLWPIAVVALWRWSRRPHRALVVATVAGIAASFAAVLVLAGDGDPTRVYMGTDTRAASLLAGALAATDPVRRVIVTLVTRLGRAVSALVTVVGAMVLWSWATVDGANAPGLYHGGLLLHSLACALVVVLVASTPSTPANRVLGWRPLAAVGVISYGLYLWHWPVYVVLSAERTGLAGPTLLATRIAVSVALAVVSFWLLEDPIRRRAPWAHGSRGLVALTGAVAGVAAILAILPAPRTEIATFDPASVATVAALPPLVTDAEPDQGRRSTVPRPTSTGPVSIPGRAAAPATTIAPTSTPATTAVATAPATTTTAPAPALLAPIGRAVWAGDSIAWDMAPGVKASLRAAGIRVDTSAAAVGLRLASGDQYTDLLKQVRQRLERDGADTIILQLSVWDASLTSAEQAAALATLRDVVLFNNACLVLVGAPVVDSAETNNGVGTLVAAARALSAADPDYVRFLDPTAVWGTTAQLDQDADGTPERKRDFVHVCPSGAARFGAWLAAELAVNFEGVAPAPPTDWAAGPWVTEPRYDLPPGACAPLTS